MTECRALRCRRSVSTDETLFYCLENFRQFDFNAAAAARWPRPPSSRAWAASDRQSERIDKEPSREPAVPKEKEKKKRRKKKEIRKEKKRREKQAGGKDPVYP